MKLLKPDTMPPYITRNDGILGGYCIEYPHGPDMVEMINLMGNNISFFLGGTIDNGASKDWQKDLIEMTSDVSDVVLISPRRDDWNADATDTELENQIIWERYFQKKVDFKIYHFEDGSISPITLLELGEYGKGSDTIVSVTPKYQRYMNVKMFCDENNIMMVDSVDDIYDFILKTRGTFVSKSIKEGRRK